MAPENRSTLVALVVPNENIVKVANPSNAEGPVGDACPAELSPEVSKDPVTVAVTLGPESSKVKSKTFCADANLAEISRIKIDKTELRNLAFIKLTPKLCGKFILSEIFHSQRCTGSSNLVAAAY